MVWIMVNNLTNISFPAVWYQLVSNFRTIRGADGSILQRNRRPLRNGLVPHQREN